MLADPRRTLLPVHVTLGPDGRPRCPWATADPEYRRYHDEEWGVPLHGDRALFEKLCLEGFQSGLSWILVLRRREAFREVFEGFEPERVAAFTDGDVERLLGDARIIRNRSKIEAAIGNARALLALEEREGPDALDRLVWSAAEPPRPDGSRPAETTELPASTPASKALSAALRKEGFRFVGPVTVYALLQSAGVVDDHLQGCWRALEPGAEPISRLRRDASAEARLGPR
jgi:DNA-3-methyladenine glycosylase I